MAVNCRRASNNCIDLVKSFEHLELKAYKKSDNVWTIGYGHTAGVKPGDVVTEEHALQFIAEDLKVAESAVNDFTKVELNQNQFDALVSLVFNIGSGHFFSSRLRARLNAGDFSGAAQEFGRWIYTNGKVMGGLVRRRKAEENLFRTKVNGEM